MLSTVTKLYKLIERDNVNMTFAMSKMFCNQTRLVKMMFIEIRPFIVMWYSKMTTATYVEYDYGFTSRTSSHCCLRQRKYEHTYVIYASTFYQQYAYDILTVKVPFT